MENLNITADTVRNAIQDQNPVLEALSYILKEVSHDTVFSLAAVLAQLGVDPSTMPGEYLIQAVLVEADRVFKPISREDWIKVYDAYTQIKSVIDANPELRNEIKQKHEAAVAAQAQGEDPLMKGDF